MGTELYNNLFVAGASICTFFGLHMCLRIQKKEHQSNTVLFSGTGAVRKDSKYRAFLGDKLRFHIHCNEYSPYIKLTAEVVNPTRLFTRPTVIRSVETSVMYGKYFSSKGFFFPPALKTDIHSLLTRLMKEKQS